MSDARAAARALDALRRGWPVTIDGAEGAVTVLAMAGMLGLLIAYVALRWAFRRR